MGLTVNSVSLKYLFHYLYKMEHHIGTFALVVVFIVGHFVFGLKVFTPKLINLKTAFVHIKVYVSFLKIRRASLPNLCFGM